MKNLWFDGVSIETKKEWVDGSYCDKLAKDIAELKKRPLVDTSKCKGCRYAPYDRRFGTCVTCIKHTKYKPGNIVRWLRLDNNLTYDTKEESEGLSDGGIHYKSIKLVEE